MCLFYSSEASKNGDQEIVGYANHTTKQEDGVFEVIVWRWFKVCHCSKIAYLLPPKQNTHSIIQPKGTLIAFLFSITLRNLMPSEFPTVERELKHISEL